MPSSNQRPGSAHGGGARRRRWPLALLLIPFAALLVPPLYARDHPTLGGIPFFLWYQFLWVLLGGVVTGLVYVLQGHRRA